MRVRMADGAVFEGEDEKAIVRQMKHDDWSSPPKKREYMVEVADRIVEMTGKEVRTVNAKAFLTDLVTTGFAAVVPDGGDEHPEASPPTWQNEAQQEWDQLDGPTTEGV
jgi:hypothetical protein